MCTLFLSGGLCARARGANIECVCSPVHSLKYLQQWNWDFFINLSEACFPIAPHADLMKFLGAYGSTMRCNCSLTLDVHARVRVCVCVCVDMYTCGLCTYEYRHTCVRIKAYLFPLSIRFLLWCPLHVCTQLRFHCILLVIWVEAQWNVLGFPKHLQSNK